MLIHAEHRARVIAQAKLSMLVTAAAHAGPDAVHQALRLLDAQLDCVRAGPGSASQIPLSQADFQRMLES